MNLVDCYYYGVSWIIDQSKIQISDIFRNLINLPS